jgi:hypothetical protein
VSIRATTSRTTPIWSASSAPRTQIAPSRWNCAIWESLGQVMSRTSFIVAAMGGEPSPPRRNALRRLRPGGGNGAIAALPQSTVPPSTRHRTVSCPAEPDRRVFRGTRIREV